MDNDVIKILKSGGVGVLLTDTLYGLVGQALNKKTVSRIYEIKGRNYDDARQSIGLVFQDPSLDDRLTAEENFRPFDSLFRVWLVYS